MVMLMRTLLFPVDNGMDNNLIGDGLAAEYDLWTGKVTWRQPSDDKIRTQQKVAFVLNLIAGILSPLAIFLFVIVVRRLGVFNSDTNSMIFKWAPLIVGVILFISFELLMLALRSRYTILEEEPDLDRQLYYYRTMYDNTIHDNSGVFNNLSVPYIGLYITFFLIFLIIPLCYHFYLHPSSFGDYLAMLLTTSVLISLFPNFIWNGILKHIIYVKLIRKTKERILESER
ncbi:hypothetical protein [Streptococcus equi]|uniref:hypothetical protein n=1 Tax=Streptococcus equi TaxID=1336 RepID=UPI0005B8F7AF|nr:hypothetical protein [Streptococcus equi]KIS12726.1 membrane protein [Streptococcus equi subsp. zooepidemicus Sz105]HEL1016791.1 hypothetical protein [Streptococcus equi subsp. ruminatorum]KIS07251.1 membrane protein [Streptococcus equi subsp. zooepidemicus Sz5]MCD3369262.1 hypothetical protein [Streptococcus equi subsp. zooepidemicus]MCD3380961.1 hypothetical protein [Streptococcus equi subsp. zooepidemicus]